MLSSSESLPQTDSFCFDGHNDVLLKLWMSQDMSGDGYIHGMDAHIDAHKAKSGGLIGGFFAIFTPQQNASHNSILGTDPISMETAQAATDAMMAIFKTIAANRPDLLKECHHHHDIQNAITNGAVAGILHIEGAEAIAPDLGNLDDYYARGLRSIGPVWSRPNAFGHGVPFGFPASPDQGSGLTPAGKDLIRACNDKKIMIDLSHLNEAGFWDVEKSSDKPLVATHSNSHQLCPSPRNLTAKQLDAIASSGGLVGVNFAAGFLRPDGQKLANTALDLMIDHLSILIEYLGEDGVALGSDFDGAIIPDAIGDASGLPHLIQAMRNADYGQALIDKITHKNWFDMIEKQIG